MTPDMTPVESTSIRSVGYDQQTGTLVVEFVNGSTYAYAAVPRETHRELLDAESIGAYFNRVVRPRYAYRRLR